MKSERFGLKSEWLGLYAKPFPFPLSPFTSNARGAFSTLELLFVVFLISLLIGLLTPGVRALHRDALKRRAKNELEMFAQALLNYQLAYGVLLKPAEDGSTPASRFSALDDTRKPFSLPSNLPAAHELALSHLLPDSEFNPRGILFFDSKTARSDHRLLDPWDVPYHVIYIHKDAADADSPVSGFILISCGPNKTPGGNDDIILQSH